MVGYRALGPHPNLMKGVCVCVCVCVSPRAAKTPDGDRNSPGGEPTKSKSFFLGGWGL